MREFVNHVHFVGIGGAGMSGIAEVLLDQGYRVTGSDLGGSKALARLRRRGAEVWVGHDASHVGGADVVVVSSAIATSNVEAVAARASGIPVIPRAEMLGELMRFGQGIAVAGTHGKTTTTSLVAAVLAQGELDPTYIVGGLVNAIDSNARLGRGRYLVAEADESDASFMHLQPLISIVTNIDADHMETYGGDFEKLRQTFVDFLHNLPFYGLAVLCLDDPVVREISARLHRQVVSYGMAADADYRIDKVRQDGLTMSFAVHRPGRDEPLELRLALPGVHNVLNATAAVAVADKLRVADEHIAGALSEFRGIGRRMQVLGEAAFAGGTVLLVDDYAHHPRELRATLEAARGAWPERRVVAVFQPHRYSRTRDLFDDFAELLAGVDPLIVTEVYPAGELPISGADGRALCRAIRRRRAIDPIFVEALDDIDEVLDALCREGDVVLMLGAGDIGRHGHRLVSAHPAPGGGR